MLRPDGRGLQIYSLVLIFLSSPVERWGTKDPSRRVQKIVQFLQSEPPVF